MGIMGGLLELVLENYYLVVTRYAVYYVYRVFFLYFSVCIISKALLLIYRHCVFIRFGQMLRISLRIWVLWTQSGCLELVLELFITTFLMTSH